MPILDHVLVFIAAVLFSLGLIVAKPVFLALATSTVGHLDLILDGETAEYEKHKLVLKSTVRLLRALVVTLVALALIIAITVAPWMLTNEFSWPGPAQLYPDPFWVSLGVVLVGGLLPFAVGSIWAEKSENTYSTWDKSLHRLYLDNRNVAKLLAGFASNHPVHGDEEKYIIVTGLARAGTTAMARLLHDSGQFASLTYQNMPFLLSPKLGRLINPSHGSKDRQRVHGDGIMVNTNSIEALEEYFWSVRTHDAYRDEGALHVHSLSAPEVNAYRNYREKVIGKSGKLYLAKNNNALLRYASLRAQSEGLRVVWMVRRPEEHAASLLRQHRQLGELQAGEPFITEYMAWLVHHEFGDDHRPFSWPDRVHRHQEYTPNQPDYWLALWLDYHERLLEYLPDERIQLFTHEELLQAPQACYDRLAQRWALPETIIPLEPYQPANRVLPPFDKALLREAEEVFTRLLDVRETDSLPAT